MLTVAVGYVVVRVFAAGPGASFLLPGGTVTGKAAVVANGSAIGGRMVQFGVNPPASPTPTPAPTATPAPAPTPPISGGTNCISKPSACGYPDATNTGVPGGTVLKTYHGTLYANQAGMVLDGYDVYGDISVGAPDVTIRNTRVHCSDATTAIWQGGDRMIVDHVEVAGDLVHKCQDAIKFRNGSEVGMTVRYSNFHTLIDAIQPSNGVSITDTYIHDPRPADAVDHSAAFGFEGGNTIPIVIRHNTFLDPNLDNSLIAMYPNNGLWPVKNATIDNNLLEGGGYTIHAPGYFVNGQDKSNSTLIRIINNRFGRNHSSHGGAYGLVTDFAAHTAANGNDWSGNVWDDNNATASAN